MRRRSSFFSVSIFSLSSPILAPTQGLARCMGRVESARGILGARTLRLLRLEQVPQPALVLVPILLGNVLRLDRLPDRSRPCRVLGRRWQVGARKDAHAFGKYRIVGRQMLHR